MNKNDEILTEVIELLDDLHDQGSDWVDPSTKIILRMAKKKLGKVQLDNRVNLESDQKALGRLLDKPLSPLPEDELKTTQAKLTLSQDQNKRLRRQVSDLEDLCRKRRDEILTLRGLLSEAGVDIAGVKA